MILKRFWPSAIVVAVILYATLASDPTGDMSLVLFPYCDKLIHAIMFGGLTGALMFDFYRHGRPLTRHLKLAVAAGVAIFGLLDECAQALLTDVRSGDAFDWLADVVGVMVACLTAPPVIKKVVKSQP